MTTRDCWLHAMAASSMLARSTISNATEASALIELAAERLQLAGLEELAREVSMTVEYCGPDDGAVRALRDRVDEAVDKLGAECSWGHS